MKNILLDVDGCVHRYNFGAITKEHFGRAVYNKDIKAYSMADALGVSDNDMREIWAKEAQKPANLIEGAVDTIKWFLANDYQVFILSSRAKIMTYSGLEKWLEKAGVPCSGMMAFGTLPEYVHVAIDDNPSKLLRIKEEAKVGKLLLFNQPWNAFCRDIKRQFIRVYDWDDVKKEVNGGIDK